MVALFNRGDRFHGHFRELIEQPDTPLQMVTTWPCVAEASHLLGPRYRIAMLQWIAGGAIQVYPFDASHLLDMCEFITKYTQQPRTEMDLADASLYWLACESNLTRIMTVDVRDFSRYRLPNGRAFEIL